MWQIHESNKNPFRDSLTKSRITLGEGIETQRIVIMWQIHESNKNPFRDSLTKSRITLGEGIETRKRIQKIEMLRMWMLS